MKVSGADKRHTPLRHEALGAGVSISPHTITGTGTKGAQLNNINIHSRMGFSMPPPSPKRVKKRQIPNIYIYIC
jgi:hypothetical protein